MTTTATSPAAPPASRASRLLPAGLALVATAVFVARGVRTGLGSGAPEGADLSTGVVLAALVAGLCVTGAVLALRSSRAAAVPLVGALGLELTVLDGYVSPPRLLAAIPLLFALAMVLVHPGGGPASSAAAGPTHPRAGSRGRGVAAAVALVAMAPVGFMYLVSGLVVPSPEVFGLYGLFAALVVVAVILARRRSWWVLAVPVASAALWFVVLAVGEQLLGWSP